MLLSGGAGSIGIQVFVYLHLYLRYLVFEIFGISDICICI